MREKAELRISRKLWCKERLRMTMRYTLLVVGWGASMCISQQPQQSLPIVVTSLVPLYPPAARVAGIEGIVRMRLSTDGKKISEINIESGQPILAKAAEDNVETWRLKEHSPVVFEVTFHYKLLSEADCDIGNAVVSLRLPTEIEISAKRVHTCDPEVEPR